MGYYIWYSEEGPGRAAAGPKISQNVNYTQKGTMEGPKARARHRGAKRRSAEGVGSGEERRSPSPVWGLGALPPEKFEI